jgi:hypothetical protein
MPTGFETSLLPEWKCHKVVRAAQIVTQQGWDLWLRVKDDPNAPTLKIQMDPREMAQKPYPSPGWYLVVYEDGYVSFSPPEAFQNGYTRKPAGDAT